MSAGALTARSGRLLILAFFFLTVLPYISLSFDNNLTLPDIDGWNCSNVTETTLESPSGNQGIWLEKTYSRETDGHSILVIVLKGPGTSWSGLPGDQISSDDGLIGSGATYRTISIAGFPAVLENHPLTGSSLAVTTANDETFTFETVFDDVGLEKFAREFLKITTEHTPGN